MSVSDTETVAFEVTRVDKTVTELPVAAVENKKPFTLPDRAGALDGVATNEYPVVHLCGYTADGTFQHYRVVGHRPYFYVPIAQANQDQLEAADFDCPLVTEYEYDNPATESVYQTVRLTPVAKAYTQLPRHVSDAKDQFETTWESDVLFPTRFLIDVGINSGVEVPQTDERYINVADVTPTDVDGDWRIHTMDIEVDDRAGFPEAGTEPILCITAYDNHTNEYITWIHTDHDADPTARADGGVAIESAEFDQLHADATVTVREFESERTMLRDYIAYVEHTRPAVISGWNVEDFDIEYLFDRCEYLAKRIGKEIRYQRMSPVGHASVHNWFGPRIKGVAVFDLLEGYKQSQFTEKESYRLDYIAELEVGETKEQYVGTIGDLWETNPTDLIAYNLRDVELCVEIDRRQEVIDFFREVKTFVGCQLSDAPVEAVAVDRYLLRTLHHEYVLPQQGHGEDKDFEGGAVFEPISGVREMVPTCDLKSLYPMSMLTINASPETKVDPETYDGETFESPNGIHFRKDRTGITKRVIDDLLERREAKKETRDTYDPDSEQYAVLDRQQTAVKVIMNALYGMMAYSRFRLYDVDVGSAVTATGRAVIRHTADVVEDLGYEVLYGDTDSVLLELGHGFDADSNPDDAIETSFAIEQAVNESYQAFAAETLNADDHRFQIEFEKLYRRFFQAGKKKRYAGDIIWKEGKEVSDTDITGFEYKRSDTAPITKEVQHRTLEMIVEGASEGDIIAYLSGIIDDYDARKYPISDVLVPQGIGQRLTEYDSDTNPVRGAKIANITIGTSFAKGSKPKFTYLDSVHPAFFERVEADRDLSPRRDGIYREWKTDPGVFCVDHPREFPPELVIAWDRMKKKTLENPLSTITEAMDILWLDIEEGNQPTKLVDFM